MQQREVIRKRAVTDGGGGRVEEVNRAIHKTVEIGGAGGLE